MRVWYLFGTLELAQRFDLRVSTAHWDIELSCGSVARRKRPWRVAVRRVQCAWKSRTIFYLLLGRGQLASVDATAAGEAAADIRTLRIDFDDQHNHYKLWRVALAESFTESLTDSSLEEPAVCSPMCNHIGPLGSTRKSGTLSGAAS